MIIYYIGELVILHNCNNVYIYWNTLHASINDDITIILFVYKVTNIMFTEYAYHSVSCVASNLYPIIYVIYLSNSGV